jgi:4-amino-4-deoxy-L-arabinose transferase-like glycosyltransferase
MLKNIQNFVYQRCKQGAIVITVVFVISFLLRIYGLGSKDFWYDEIYSVWYAASPWQNWNAPLYWILLHFWVKIFGISEFSLRFPGMLFSFFTMAIVFLFAKKLFNKKTATLATLLIGLSSFHLWYAQEARDYSMVLFFGTLSSYLLFLAIKKISFKRWAWFVIISLVGVYTNYFFIFLIIAQALYILYLTKFRVDRTWWLFLFIAGAFIFYLPRFMSKFLFVSEGFWIPKPNWQSLNIILQNYMLGYNGTAFLYAFSSFLTLVSFIILFLVMYQKREMRQNICFCGFLLFIPLGLAFLFSKLFFSVYLNRGLLLFSPYFYFLISCAVFESSKRIRVVLAVVLIFIFSCGAYRYFCNYIYPPKEYRLGVHPKKPVRPVVNFLDNNVKDGDLVAFTNKSVMPGIDFYSKRRFPQYYLFSPQVLDWGRKSPPEETRYCVPINKISGLRFKRIWVISMNWERNGGLNKNSIMIKHWLDINLKLLLSQELDGLWVYCYERNNSLN